MDIQSIIGVIGAIVAGSGGVWAIWRAIKGYLPANQSRDAMIEEVLKQLHNHSMKGQEAAPSVPDRATALQYVEAVLRFMESQGSKEGVDALIKVMAEIAKPTVTVPKE
jgi:hypothetical protein